MNISAIITYLPNYYLNFLSNEPATPIIHDLIIFLSQVSLFGELAERVWTDLSLKPPPGLRSGINGGLRQKHHKKCLWTIIKYIMAVANKVRMKRKMLIAVLNLNLIDGNLNLNIWSDKFM